MGEASQFEGSQDLKPDTVPLNEEIPVTIAAFDNRPPAWGALLPINCKLSKDLVQDTYSIGRAAKMCEIFVSEEDVEPELHKLISKVHCRITRSKMNSDNDYLVFLEDLSSNGTFVNQEKVGKNEKTIISNEDEISFATPQYKVFRYIECNKEVQYLPPELNSKYHVSKLLGVGGFGEVVLIVNKKTRENFAVKKLLKSELDELKILNEVRILRLLKHPCVVQMLDLFDNNKAVFILMEYVPDGNLLQKIQKDKRLSESLSKLITYQLTWAVDYFHDQGISHRDLKPENILIFEKDGGLVVAKVADFGLSKVLNSNTRLKTPCGTLHYTAPEVLLSKGEHQYSSKVDTWGLGIVLYMCLSGCRPFLPDNGHTGTLVAKILRAAYPLPRAIWQSVSTGAQSLIKQLLTNNVQLRLSSSQTLHHYWFKDISMGEQMTVLFGIKSPFKNQYRTNETSSPPPKMPKIDELSSAIDSSILI